MKTRFIDLLKSVGIGSFTILAIVGALVIHTALAQDKAEKQGWKVSEIPQETTKTALDNEIIGSEAHRIDLYLKSKGSPMEGVGENCVAMAEKYQIPCDLMIGIAGAESGFGMQGYAVGSNNPFGLGVHLGWSFDNWSQSFEKLAETLRLYYFNEGRTDVWSIRPKYCPRGIDGNGYGTEWEDRVLHFQEELNNYKE